MDNTQEHKPTFMAVLIDRIKHMFDLKQITNNLIALTIAGFALYFVYHQTGISWVTDYSKYFTTIIMVIAGAQIIRAGVKGNLLLPALALVLGYIICHTLHPHQTLFTYGKTFYIGVTTVGLVGVIFAIFSMY